MSDLLLDVKDLHTYFRTDEGVVKAVSGVDFAIKKGETVGLVGESGCGKSVTSLSIMRLIPEPQGFIPRGEIRFENQDLLKLKEAQMRRVRGNDISMIFQEPMTSLNPVHRIGRQIGEVLRLHLGLSSRAAKEKVVGLLAQVGIPDPGQRYQDYPFQLSGGMRQRVVIAMALACQPKLIIADEPTTALDVTIQAQILRLMSRLQKEVGSSILMITHDLGVIAETVQKVAVMYAGKVIEQAGTGIIFSDAKHPYTRGLLDSIPEMDRPVPADKKLRAIPGTVPSLLNLPIGCSFQDRCGHVMDHCRREEPRLLESGADHLVRCFLYE